MNNRSPRKKRPLEVLGTLIVVAAWAVLLFFFVDLVQITGWSVYAVLAALGLIAVGGACLLFGSRQQRRPRAWTRKAVRMALVSSLLFSGPITLALRPEMPFQSFVWRNERSFLESTRGAASVLESKHFATGSWFRVDWWTVTDAYLYFVFDPARRPNDPLLPADGRFNSHSFEIQHLFGSWYSAVH